MSTERNRPRDLPGAAPQAAVFTNHLQDTQYSAVSPLYALGNLLPLPEGKKFPPPGGYTGESGRDVTDVERTTWAAQVGNYALRLPDGVVGIDVDQYGQKRGLDTIREREAELGQLPDTWTSTSREYASGSGIRFYRYPGGKLAGAVGESVEVIQHSHRYAVVWPSVVDDRAYRWYRPDGTVAERPPKAEELPELPEA